MCKNRWCSEKPKKTTPKLTILLSVDHAEVDTICNDRDSKQTKRGFSTLATVNQKLLSMAFFGFSQLLHFLTHLPKRAEIGTLPPFITQEDVQWVNHDLGYQIVAALNHI